MPMAGILSALKGTGFSSFRGPGKYIFIVFFSRMETLYKVVLFLKPLAVLNKDLFFSIDKGKDTGQLC